MPNEEPDAGTERLASAFRDIISDAVERAVKPLRQDMRAMEDRLNKRIDTVSATMQAQFAEQEKKLGKILKETCG